MLKQVPFALAEGGPVHVRPATTQAPREVCPIGTKKPGMQGEQKF